MTTVNCLVDKIDNKYILKPIVSLSESNLVKSSNHISNYYDTNYIFDIRKFILNKKINSNLYFYIKLYDENKNVINLNGIDFESTLYVFNRVKEKINRRTYLNYYPKINDYINEKFNYNIYAGCTDYITCKTIAFETSNYFYNFYSNNGGGFYGFYISTRKEINPIYADILISKIKYDTMTIPSATFYDNVVLDFNDNNQEVIPSAPNFNNIELPTYEEVIKNDDYYIGEPSAPFYDKQFEENNDIKPSAPFYDKQFEENNDIKPSAPSY